MPQRSTVRTQAGVLSPPLTEDVIAHEIFSTFNNMFEPPKMSLCEIKMNFPSLYTDGETEARRCPLT